MTSRPRLRGRRSSGLQSHINGLRGNSVTITTRYVDLGKNPTSKAGGITKAEGGYISGPGRSTSDSIAAFLSNGEYVMKAPAVAKYGKTFFDQINAMRFASGGYASRFAPAPTPVAAAPTGPLVSIGQMVVRDENTAARAVETKQRDAIAVYGLR
jgi:hypothetical protein